VENRKREEKMNTDTMIKWTNRICLFAITLLIYWVFIFISITVFDFKVFRENITETFYLSILAILALMSGALVVNIMFNLTKISSAVGHGSMVACKKGSKKSLVLVLLSFPVIFGILFLGDLRSASVKEKTIREAAESLVKENQQALKQLSNYQFSTNWIKQTQETLKLLGKIDENFPNVQLILQDKVQDRFVFLVFDDYHYEKNSTPERSDFIYSCSSEERIYFTAVFAGKRQERFSSSDGHYELYYPVEIDGKVIILYFSERQRYGKLGS
jgi:hypothetical protein